MPPTRNDVEVYEDDQIVVEQRHSGLVIQALAGLDVHAVEHEANAKLRLSLVGLQNVESAAATLRHDTALVKAAVGASLSRSETATTLKDLDLLLFALRRAMRDKHGGWEATLGKNHVVEIEATPYIKGDFGVPEHSDRIEIQVPPGQPGARVAILDTEFVAHPALAGRYLGDVTVNAGPTPQSTQAHATFVAGLVAQRAPGAELVMRRVLDKNGLNSSSWDVAKAIVDILDFDIDVLNLSLSCATVDRLPPLSLVRAIERVLPSVVVVAAAGNVRNNVPAGSPPITATTPQFPAAIDGVVSVGAYDPKVAAMAAPGEPFHPVSFSPTSPWVEFLAPGARVHSTFIPGTVGLMQFNEAGKLAQVGTKDFPPPAYAIWDGTSFAAAIVTGAIAAGVKPGQVSAYESLARLREPSTAPHDIALFTAP